MSSELTIRRVTIDDDLKNICAQTRPEQWAADNEMKQYEVKSLEVFLANGMNWFVIAWQGERIAAMALCYELLHPDGQEHTLYVHELDTHPDFRRQGVATKLMNWLEKEAKKCGMSEVWLGAEADAAQPMPYTPHSSPMKSPARLSTAFIRNSHKRNK